MNANCDCPDEMKEVDRLVLQAVNNLAEHVDAVTILVNKRRNDGGEGTWQMVNGRGNWFARFGHAKAWVLQSEADMKEPERTD